MTLETIYIIAEDLINMSVRHFFAILRMVLLIEYCLDGKVIAAVCLIVV